MNLPNLKELADTIIRGEKALVFPLKVELGGIGWISDQQGHHVFDMRGWGWIQYKEKGAEEFQDDLAQAIVKAINDVHEYYVSEEKSTKV